jgi:hypothetical protein
VGEGGREGVGGGGRGEGEGGREWGVGEGGEWGKRAVLRGLEGGGSRGITNFFSICSR